MPGRTYTVTSGSTPCASAKTSPYRPSTMSIASDANIIITLILQCLFCPRMVCDHWSRRWLVTSALASTPLGECSFSSGLLRCSCSSVCPRLQHGNVQTMGLWQPIACVFVCTRSQVGCFCLLGEGPLRVRCGIDQIDFVSTVCEG